MLGTLGILRYVGLMGLALLELKLAVSVYRAVVVSGQSAAQAEQQLTSAGTPAWVARLMALEASLWRKLWEIVRRVFEK